jgi:LmbE family N-acetylglucosaminyl deacetylase
MAFPWLARDGLAPHRVRRLYLFWSNTPSAWVDVSMTIERKLAALREHRSQIKDPERLETWIRRWAAEDGERIGVEAAETLRVVVIDEDDEVEGPGSEDAALVEDAEAAQA